MEITITTATSEQDFELAKKLMKEYAADIGVDLSFQDFETELKNVATRYTEPDGTFVIAYHNNQPVGCFGIRKMDSRTCELKRMYLRREARGNGWGEKLLKAAIDKAAALNYQCMRLDTLPSMTSAIRLYQKVGFKEIEPYRFNPIAGSKFMEIDVTLKNNRGNP
ncbi:MAG: GNAT family N-acetyltransferase [Cyclobacteriaceae bacterium]|nr:GNAT family N-acetyltransferase [Cyclobacteriaceae bacterium]